MQGLMPEILHLSNLPQRVTITFVRPAGIFSSISCRAFSELPLPLFVLLAFSQAFLAAPSGV
jgi:hypothetical protein